MILKETNWNTVFADCSHNQLPSVQSNGIELLSSATINFPNRKLKHNLLLREEIAQKLKHWEAKVATWEVAVTPNVTILYLRYNFLGMRCWITSKTIAVLHTNTIPQEFRNLIT